MTDEQKEFLDASSGISESDRQKIASGNYEAVLEESKSSDGWNVVKGVLKEKDGQER